MTRALGLDLGTRRIGVALSDPGRVLATPLTTVERCDEPELDRRRILELVAEHEVGVIVVGLPVSLDGTEGPAAVAARAEIDALAVATTVPVEPYDERFTTVTAEQRLAERGVRGRRRRSVVDQSAAAVLLQAWLDGGGRTTRTEQTTEP